MPRHRRCRVDDKAPAASLDQPALLNPDPKSDQLKTIEPEPPHVINSRDHTLLPQSRQHDTHYFSGLLGVASLIHDDADHDQRGRDCAKPDQATGPPQDL